MNERVAQRKTRKLLAKIAEHDPVPCNGCTACCRNHQAVTWQEGDDPSLFTAFGKVGQEWVSLLPQKGNGDCGYLGEAGCTVYDRRPIVCRAFDCRRQAATFTPEQQVRALMTPGVYSLDVFVAGRERLHTVKPLPEEEALEGKGLAEYLLAGGRR
jgi:Fe-S-cluster containining protein